MKKMIVALLVVAFAVAVGLLLAAQPSQAGVIDKLISVKDKVAIDLQRTLRQQQLQVVSGEDREKAWVELYEDATHVPSRLMPLKTRFVCSYDPSISIWVTYEKDGSIAITPDETGIVDNYKNVEHLRADVFMKKWDHNMISHRNPTNMVLWLKYKHQLGKYN